MNHDVIHHPDGRQDDLPIDMDNLPVIVTAAPHPLLGANRYLLRLYPDLAGVMKDPPSDDLFGLLTIVLGCAEQYSPENHTIFVSSRSSYEGDGTNKIMRVGIGGHNLELRYVMDSVSLEAGQTYTMTYDVGAKDHTQPYTVYTAQLLGYDAEAGEMNLLTSEYHDADADPSTWENEHEMTTHTLSYTATAEDEEMGLKLVMGFWHYWGGDSTSRSANLYVDNVSVTAVPEPATMVLLGLGGLMLRRKK